MLNKNNYTYITCYKLFRELSFILYKYIMYITISVNDITIHKSFAVSDKFITCINS